MFTILLIAQLIVSLALLALVMLQARNEGMGGIFGAAESVTRTRRGVDQTIFNLTVAFAVLFLLISIVTVYVQP